MIKYLRTSNLTFNCNSYDLVDRGTLHFYLDKNIGSKAVGAVQGVDVSLSLEDIFRFDLREMEEDQECMVLIFCSLIWIYILERRFKVAKPRLFEVRKILKK